MKTISTTVFLKEQFITTSRCKHFVRSSGEGEPLLLLHGLPQSSYCWRDVAKLLSPHCQVTLPDLRGMGDSERSPNWQDYRKIELAKDMLALLEEMRWDSCMLVGHDWGGSIAQEMTFLAPQKIKKLALLNITINRNIKGFAAAKEEYAKKKFNASWYQAFQHLPGMAEKMIEGNEEIWIRTLLSSIKNISETDLQEYIRCYSIPGTALSGANYYRAFSSDIRYWRKTAEQKIACPTLYLYGNRDPIIVPASLEGIENCFDLPLKRIDIPVGHFVPEEAAEQVALELKKFFRLSSN